MEEIVLNIQKGAYWLEQLEWHYYIVYLILRASIGLIFKTVKEMLKALAKKLAKVIAPIVFRELIYVLEELLKTDINDDGNIGKP